MKKLLLFLICLMAGPYGLCQSSMPATAGSDWSRVMAIAPGTSMHVSAKHHGGICRMKVATEDSFTCSTLGADKVFPRTEVRKIKLTRRAVSTLVSAGIVGVGLGTSTALVNTRQGEFFHNGQAFAAGLLVGAVIGAPIGFFSDLARGPLVYRAP